MIADYLFNKVTVAGHRLMVLLTQLPLTREELSTLTGMTEAQIKALPSITAWSLPNMEVTSFGYLRTRSQASAYAASATAAFSLPSTCVFTPVRSSPVGALILVLMNAGVAIRSYQGVAGSEVKLSRNTVSIEDKQFVSKILIGGMRGQQIGDAEALTVPDAEVFTVDTSESAIDSCAIDSSVFMPVLISRPSEARLYSNSTLLR